MLSTYFSYVVSAYLAIFLIAYYTEQLDVVYYVTVAPFFPLFVASFIVEYSCVFFLHFILHPFLTMALGCQELFGFLTDCYFFLLNFNPLTFVHMVYRRVGEAIVSIVVCDPPRTLLFVFRYPQSTYCASINALNNVRATLSFVDSCILIAVIGFIVGLWLLSRGLSMAMTYQQICLRFLGLSATPPLLPSEVLRSAFTSAELTKLPPVPGHSHGVCAADRSSASNFVDRLGPLVSLIPYYVQRSRSDERKDREGSRVHYWTKDLNTTEQEFTPPLRALYAMIDVDQYIDMPSFLCDFVAPIVIYTFQPNQVARNSIEYSYTFREDNTVHYTVAGGGKYEHLVWNYGLDNIFVKKTFLGIPYKTASYSVERRRTMDDHELILLTPLCSWRGLASWFSLLHLQGKPLERLSIARGKFLRLSVNSADRGQEISTGKPGQFAQATVSAEVDNTLSTIARTSKFDLTMPQAVSLVGGDKVAGAVLLEYHRANTDDVKADVVCPVSDAVKPYQYNLPTFDPAEKPLMVPFMTPMIDECYVPTNSVTSERAAIKERITDVRPPLLPLTPFLSKTMLEFATFLIPEPNILDPVDDDYLYDHQPRPTQRRILDTLVPGEPKRVVNSFLKKECYTEIKPPRLISTVNGNDKAAYSKYIYAVTDQVMKHQSWYAFGKTPLEISQRVAEVCASAKVDASKSDFHKFDGHGSNVMREFERIILVRAFRQVYMEEVTRLHQTQYKLRAFTANGESYESEYARLSGSAETACFNGLTNSYVKYLEARLSGKTPEEAWASLGIYGGDDGLSADVDAKNYVRAARMIGQDIEVEKVLVGEPGITFLARVYSPNVWFGDLNTMCDLNRQLSKFHVTVKLGNNVTPLMKLTEKCRSFWFTDRETPVLGWFVQRARYLYNSDFEINPDTVAVRRWGSTFEADVQYVNIAADWMMEYILDTMPTLEYKKLLVWLETTTAFADLLTPPLLREAPLPKSKVPVVLSNEHILPLEPIVKPKMTPQEFEVFKTERIAAGTWKEKPRNDSTTRAPRKIGARAT